MKIPTLVLVALVPALAWGQPCVTGRVMSVESGEPIAGAAVSAMWTESRKQRLHTTKETTSDSTGHYRLCLTRNASVLLQALVGTAIAYVPLTMPGTDTTVADVRVPAQTDTGAAIVAGHVVSETGAPIEGAMVSMLGGRAETQSAKDGAYGLRGPEGSQVLVVRRVGLGVAVVAVDLSEHQPRLVNVTMQHSAATLTAVNIVADRVRLQPVYDAIGFTLREQQGHGHFMTEEQIDARQASETTQLFEGMPGVKYRYDHTGQLRILPDRGPSTLEGYGDCTAYFIDGTLIGNGHAVYTVDADGNPQSNDDETVLPRPADLIAIEVYQPNEPSPVPAGVVDRCLKVFLWTKAKLGKS